MKYKHEIWDFFIKFSEEQHLINYKKNKDREETKPFFDMEYDRFYKLLNTFTWLTKYNLSNIVIEETITKPTNEDFLDAISIVKSKGEELLIFTKTYPQGEVKNDLIKIAKKRIACAKYYKELIEQNYFDKI